jgi:hypothetical protein
VDLIRGERVAGLIDDPVVSAPPPRKLHGRVLSLGKAGALGPRIKDAFTRSVLCRNEDGCTDARLEQLHMLLVDVSAFQR